MKTDQVEIVYTNGGKQKKQMRFAVEAPANAPPATLTRITPQLMRVIPQLMKETCMRDMVLFLVFGAFVWAATVVGFVSIYIYAGDNILCGALSNQDACLRLEWLQSRNVRLIARELETSLTQA